MRRENCDNDVKGKILKKIKKNWEGESGENGRDERRRMREKIKEAI